MLHDTPPTALPFVKMHGLGNDFVIIESRRTADRLTAALVSCLSDRHRGIGFDQLAEIRDSHVADVALVFWNADGTQSGACGNATRCVAAREMEHRGIDWLTLETDRGILRAERTATGTIRVNMGQPQLDWRDIPLAQPVEIDALPLDGSPAAVGMGNPHCVFFVEDAEAVDLATRGPDIETDALFPDRTNVEFVSALGQNRLRTRVWERGAGITQACGSGACAVAVAAARRGLAGPRVEIALDGGTLTVEITDDGVWLSGPTRMVFSGTLDADYLARVVPS